MTGGNKLGNHDEDDDDHLAAFQAMLAECVEAGQHFWGDKSPIAHLQCHHHDYDNNDNDNDDKNELDDDNDDTDDNHRALGVGACETAPAEGGRGQTCSK